MPMKAYKCNQNDVWCLQFVGYTGCLVIKFNNLKTSVALKYNKKFYLEPVRFPGISYKVCNFHKNFF